MFLKEGAVVQIGSPEEIYENPNSIYVSQRLGSPKINILPGSLFKSKDEPPKIGFRPENVSLGNGQYEGKIISFENLGSETVVALIIKAMRYLHQFKVITNLQLMKLLILTLMQIKF